MKTVFHLLFSGLITCALLAKKKAAAPEGVPTCYALVALANQKDDGQKGQKDDALVGFSNHKMVYFQGFDGNEAQAKNSFWFTNPHNWKMPAVRGKSFIEFQSKGHNYKYKVRSPYTIGLVKEVEVKDFVLEAQLQQTGKEYGHRDMCIFYNFQDRSHFYYTHIASVTDAHAHNCFIVNDKPRTKISHETTKGHKWSARDWHDVRLVREHASGKIEVYVNDMKKPIMRAIDKTFDWGRIGFGSFDDTGRVRNIRLYAPESRKSKAGDPFVEGRK